MANETESKEQATPTSALEPSSSGTANETESKEQATPTSTLEHSSSGTANETTFEELPEHWKVPKCLILSVPFQALCLVSVGRPNLVRDWESKIKEDVWERDRKKVIDRLNNTNIVAGLLLTASVVFISTQPPLPSFVSYTKRASYVFAFASFAHALGALACGLAVINIYESCDRVWTKEVLTATRFRLCCTLTFMTMPAISLTLSIVCLIIALLVMCFASELWWVRLLAIGEILGWMWLPLAFVWCALEVTLPAKAKRRRSKL